MAHYFGRDMIVTIEQPDGQVFRGKCSATNITVQHGGLGVIGNGPITPWEPGGQTWEITLNGYGELFWNAHDGFARRVQDNRSAAEWRCDFCGSVHPRHAVKCVQCGAARSFLYE